MTREKVLEMKAAYEAALAEYHRNSNTTVRTEMRPDGYRGDLHVETILDEVELTNCRGDGWPYTYDVEKNGVKVGVLHRTFGNNGRGEIASAEFRPAEGVTVLQDGNL